MGIYIKKMEMPESCYYCPFADGVWQKDKRCLINGKEMPRDGRDVQQNHINCPLVPVPPHGRLIDADALEMERREENAQKGWHDSFAVVFNGDPYYEAIYDCTEQFKELVNNAPTIIPAEPFNNLSKPFKKESE